jgi:hypothetical protein
MTQISGLTRRSEEALAKAMSYEDLKFMAHLHNDVVKGREPLQKFRLNERAMAAKYGFKIKQRV